MSPVHGVKVIPRADLGGQNPEGECGGSRRFFWARPRSGELLLPPHFLGQNLVIWSHTCVWEYEKCSLGMSPRGKGNRFGEKLATREGFLLFVNITPGFVRPAGMQKASRALRSQADPARLAGHSLGRWPHPMISCRPSCCLHSCQQMWVTGGEGKRWTGHRKAPLPSPWGVDFNFVEDRHPEPTPVQEPSRLYCSPSPCYRPEGEIHQLARGHFSQPWTAPRASLGRQDRGRSI